MNGSASVNDVSSDVALPEIPPISLPLLLRAFLRPAPPRRLFPYSSSASRAEVASGISEDVATKHVGLRGSDEQREPLRHFGCVGGTYRVYRAAAGRGRRCGCGASGRRRSSWREAPREDPLDRELQRVAEAGERAQLLHGVAHAVPVRLREREGETRLRQRRRTFPCGWKVNCSCRSTRRGEIRQAVPCWKHDFPPTRPSCWRRRSSGGTRPAHAGRICSTACAGARRASAP